MGMKVVLAREKSVLLLGPEHRWCEEPLEIAIFIPNM